MPFFQLTNAQTRKLVVMDLAAGALLILGAAWILFRPAESGGSAISRDDRARGLLVQQSRPVWNLLVAELDKARSDTKALADWTTHIFSNPESYRLSAQPSEYDYDERSGTYGSVRNDGSSVAFLSAATSLNPEILREIRLSEYLNPIFKSTTSLHATYRDVTFYTTDSLVRRYPWFDFRSLIESGQLKRQFAVTELPFFASAMPSRNPRREAICESATEDVKGSRPQVVCSAPFFAGDVFRGVVAVSLSGNRLAGEVFQRAGVQQSLSMLLGQGGLVLGMTQNLGQQALNTDRESGPDTLKDLRFRDLSGLDLAVRRIQDDSSFGRYAGFSWLTTSGRASAPVTLVTIVPTGEVDAALSRASSSSRGIIIGGMVFCAALLGLNVWWVLGIERNVNESARKLRESFTALSDLNLDSALIQGSEGVLSDLYPKLNAGVESVQKALEAGRQSETCLPAGADPIWESVPPADFRSPSELEAELEDDSNRLKDLSHQVTILSSLEASDSLESNFSRVASALRSILEARQASFLAYLPAEGVLRTAFLDVSVPPPNEPVIELKEGFLLTEFVHSQSITIGNVSALSFEEQQQLSSIVQDNYLVLPLLDDGKLLGAALLAGKSEGFSQEDQRLMGELQPTISTVLKNLYQYEGLRKVSLLRSEYCMELSRAVESTLDRIREEVQSIYSRLGKLTPYYKQHCETILFEVGKLYEIIQEAREMEQPAQPTSEPARLASES